MSEQVCDHKQPTDAEVKNFAKVIIDAMNGEIKKVIEERPECTPINIALNGLVVVCAATVTRLAIEKDVLPEAIMVRFCSNLLSNTGLNPDIDALHSPDEPEAK